jgi:hypothetical protein
MDPDRAALRRELERSRDAVRDSFTLRMIEELACLRANECEPLLDASAVKEAHDRMQIREVLRLARRDRRWVLAWLLARYLPDIRAKSARR